MTGQSRRRSIHIGGFKHANPIPNASRIGNLVMSGVILGRDAEGKMPDSMEAQCANMFAHMKAIVEAAGGTHRRHHQDDGVAEGPLAARAAQ